ncbi:hypothetical protein [Marinovum sp. KMM 9879]
MKKSVITFVGLPLAFAVAGYAGGLVLPAAARPQHSAVAPEIPDQTAAALVLDTLAEEEAAKLVVDEAATAPGDPAETARENHRTNANVVRLGRVSIPVYRASSVTYVMSDVGVEMRDVTVAAAFAEAENAARLRDAVLTSLHKAAEGLSLTGGAVDTPQLSERLATDLRAGFGSDVANVLLLSLIQADVPRS